MKRDLVAWSLGLDRHGWFGPSRAGILCPTRSGRIRFPGVSRLVGAFSFCGSLREPCAGLKTTNSGPPRSVLRFHVECFSMWKMCSFTSSVEICREPLHDGILSIRDQMSSDFLMTCGACSGLNGVRYSVRLESFMNLLWLTGSFLRQGNEQWSFQRSPLVPLTLESTGSSETRLPQTLMWTEQPRFDFGRVSWLQFGASLQVSASSDAFRQPAWRRLPTRGKICVFGFQHFGCRRAL